jgi:hypothetical protein
MGFFSVAGIGNPGLWNLGRAFLSAEIIDPGYSAATIRFSPIRKSAARLIVLPIAAGVYVFSEPFSTEHIVRFR